MRLWIVHALPHANLTLQRFRPSCTNLAACNPRDFFAWCQASTAVEGSQKLSSELALSPFPVLLPSAFAILFCVPRFYLDFGILADPGLKDVCLSCLI